MTREKREKRETKTYRDKLDGHQDPTVATNATAPPLLTLNFVTTFKVAPSVNIEPSATVKDSTLSVGVDNSLTSPTSIINNNNNNNISSTTTTSSSKQKHLPRHPTSKSQYKLKTKYSNAKNNNK